ncbi:MAG: hypothetical protein ABI772_12565 [Bacteroidota bacterium]
MLKDIPQLQVTDIAIAIVPVEDSVIENEEDALWEVYILNLKSEPIENVIVSSQGYGSYQGESVKTSILRQFLGTIEAGSYMQVEAIQKKVFGLNNEYWVSFYINKEIFDKKYVFLPESISEEFYTHIPLIDLRGVMIK